MNRTKNYLWLDDVRNPVENCYTGALWVRSARVAIQLIMDNPGFFWEISLDHDLAGHPDNTLPGPMGDGYEVIKFLEETGSWPEGGVRVHSSNTPARERMLVPIRAHYGRDFQWGISE